MQAVLHEVLANLDMAIRETNATITYDAMPTIRAEASQMAQVLQNLLANALKFRGDRPPVIHVGARREEEGWLFWVSDNGIGIDSQYAQRIFLIFQRLHTRRQFAGTGVGLAICRKIVDRHGGKIWVESQPGEGSTFYFTIPDREVTA